MPKELLESLAESSGSEAKSDFPSINLDKHMNNARYWKNFWSVSYGVLLILIPFGYSMFTVISDTTFSTLYAYFDGCETMDKEAIPLSECLACNNFVPYIELPPPSAPIFFFCIGVLAFEFIAAELKILGIMKITDRTLELLSKGVYTTGLTKQNVRTFGGAFGIIILTCGLVAVLLSLDVMDSDQTLNTLDTSQCPMAPVVATFSPENPSSPRNQLGLEDNLWYTIFSLTVPFLAVAPSVYSMMKNIYGCVPMHDILKHGEGAKLGGVRFKVNANDFAKVVNAYYKETGEYEAQSFFWRYFISIGYPTTLKAENAVLNKLRADGLLVPLETTDMV